MKIGDIVLDVSDGCILIYLGKETGPSIATYRFMEIHSGKFWDYERWDVQSYIEVINESGRFGET